MNTQTTQLMKKAISLGCLFIVLLLAVVPAKAQWTKTNGPTGSIVNSIVVKNTTIYAGTDTAGVFVSSDKGLNWVNSSTGLTSKNVQAMIVTGNTMLAANFSGSPDGNIFLSTNNAASWKPLTNKYFGVIFCFNMNATSIFAGTWYGVIKSTDNGNNWTSITNNLPSNASVVAIANNGAAIFAGINYSTAGGTGIFVSTNNGASWTAKNTGLATTLITALATNGSNVYAGIQGAGVFLSTNNGTSWTAMNTGLTNMNIKTFLINGSNVFAGTSDGIFVSTNNGSWIKVSNGLPSNTPVYSMAINGTDLYLGTSSTVWKRPLPEMVSGIHEISSSQSAAISIYPNPFSSSATIELNAVLEIQHVELRLYNLLGQEVMQMPIVRQSTQIERKDLPAGIYSYVITSTTSIVGRGKLIIQ